MKSTKNIFITGVVLAIALFASVQVNAMEQRINPYLSAPEKEALEYRINKLNGLISGLKKNNMDSTQQEKQLKRYEDLYYGVFSYDIELLDLNNKRVNPRLSSQEKMKLASILESRETFLAFLEKEKAPLNIMMKEEDQIRWCKNTYWGDVLYSERYLNFGR
jgi:hypothetical protein